jgi:hypothetical protein
MSRTKEIVMSNQTDQEATSVAESRAALTINNLISGPKTRTTLLISKDLDRLVEVCAAVERRQKSEIVNEALAEYMKDKKELHSLSIK